MLFTPPQNIALRDRSKKSIFLAGSIGANDDLTKLCNDWQQELGEWLLSKDFNIFNPRRKIGILHGFNHMKIHISINKLNGK